VAFTDNMFGARIVPDGNLPLRDWFAQDGMRGVVARVEFDPVTFTTRVIPARRLPPGDFTGRSVWIGTAGADGAWQVIREASARSLTVWGRLPRDRRANLRFEILRTFQPPTNASEAPGAFVSTFATPGTPP
jgi:hypothetical protein